MSAVNATESAISREDIFSMLKHCLVKQPTEEDPDEGVKDLVELMLKKMVCSLLRNRKCVNEKIASFSIFWLPIKAFRF